MPKRNIAQKIVKKHNAKGTGVKKGQTIAHFGPEIVDWDREDKPQVATRRYSAKLPSVGSLFDVKEERVLNTEDPAVFNFHAPKFERIYGGDSEPIAASSPISKTPFSNKNIDVGEEFTAVDEVEEEDKDDTTNNTSTPSAKASNSTDGNSLTKKKSQHALQFEEALKAQKEAEAQKVEMTKNRRSSYKNTGVNVKGIAQKFSVSDDATTEKS